MFQLTVEAREWAFTHSMSHKFKRFDVRDLLANGIEPFPEIFKRVQALAPDEGLIVVAPFLPSPLIERLGAEGFKSRVERGQRGEWTVYFWRENE